MILGGFKMECKECGKYLTQNEIKDGWCHACGEEIDENDPFYPLHEEESFYGYDGEYQDE